MAPAPRSKPSSRTYTAIMMAIRQNQIVSISPSSICGDGDCWFAARTAARLRPHLNFAIQQEKPENSQNAIQSHEADQREPRVARADSGRDAVRGAHQAVDQPRLTAKLGRQPP